MAGKSVPLVKKYSVFLNVGLIHGARRHAFVHSAEWFMVPPVGDNVRLESGIRHRIKNRTWQPADDDYHVTIVFEDLTPVDEDEYALYGEQLLEDGFRNVGWTEVRQQ